MVLKEGRVIFDGPTDEALTNPLVLEQIGDWDKLRNQMRDTRRLG